MCRMLRDEVGCHSSTNEDYGKQLRMEGEDIAELLMVIFIG